MITTQPMNRWDRLLAFACVATGCSGLFFVVAGGATEAIFNRMVFGSAPSPVVGSNARDYLKFVYRVLGAVMVGWTASLAPTVLGPLRRRERWAWSQVAWSIGIWFSVDTAASLASGFPENALLNVGFGLLFAIPLAGMRPTLVDAPIRADPR